MNKQFAKTLVVLWLLIFSNIVMAESLSSIEQEVQDVYYAWCASIGEAKGNSQEVVKFYAQNAILLPTLSPDILVNYQRGLDDYFTHLTTYPNIKCKTDMLITHIYGDHAINSGLYTFTYDDNASSETKELPARFTFHYIKENNNWLIINHHSSKFTLSNS